MDSNTWFAQIEQIMQAKKALAKQLEPSEKSLTPAIAHSTSRTPSSPEFLPNHPSSRPRSNHNNLVNLNWSKIHKFDIVSIAGSRDFMMAKKYTEENLQKAISAIRNGSMSVRKAAEEWGVPPSTIQSRIKKGVRPKGEYEATVLQQLSPTQEKHLAAWITIQEDLGVPVSHRQIRLFADRILQANGSSETVGNGWLPRFFKRHPEVKTKKAKRVDYKRIEGATTEVIRTWFEKLVLPAIEDMLPEHRGNMDELGVMEGMGTNGLCVGRQETRVAIAKSPENRIWITIIECITAAGQSLPPCPLKNSYRRYLNDIILQRNGLPLNKQDFIVAYARAREDLMYSKNVRSGWEASGLWPLNIEKPLASRFVDVGQPRQVSTPRKRRHR
ncbi:hypothetical protein CHGG_05062 [Chaetomium globosum CBS 148.51]|uniref:HTH CENPB-type domain-containing protein n=1 Tax=Chaetomium globosum (strain ATCC 6205 / CBS 148.51 / DSM 1962 / NBRC 6347 / NRRL 1970) TaxID=306901 RepID=Q2GZI4_CHAGB|nr:uncharacterized protein CHGG_05062 [Chaetomium globosum CBS 148.51]EAQ88443.1 hypothetical protein CHGG_05062 [Chaetomium globosum CBS 148.51]